MSKPQLVKVKDVGPPDPDTLEREAREAAMADPEQKKGVVEQVLASMAEPPVMVPISLLDTNSVQPKDRTKDVDKLMTDIFSTHRIDPILVARKKGSKRFTIINGHRRTEAATRLGLDQIVAYVITSDEPTPLLWMRFNESGKAIKAVDYFWAWGAEAPTERENLLAHIPPGTRKQIRSIVEIFGLPDAVNIALRQATPDLDIKRRISPHFVTWIQTTNSLLASRNLEKLDPKQIGLWLMKHSMTSMIRTLGVMKKDLTTPKSKIKRLRTSIEQDEPFKLKGR